MSGPSRTPRLLSYGFWHVASGGRSCKGFTVPPQYARAPSFYGHKAQLKQGSSWGVPQVSVVQLLLCGTGPSFFHSLCIMLVSSSGYWIFSHPLWDAIQFNTVGEDPRCTWAPAMRFSCLLYCTSHTFYFSGDNFLWAKLMYLRRIAIKKAACIVQVYILASLFVVYVWIWRKPCPLPPPPHLRLQPAYFPYSLI